MRASSRFVFIVLLCLNVCTATRADEINNNEQASPPSETAGIASCSNGQPCTLFGRVEDNGSPRIKEFLEAVSLDYGLT